MKCARSDVYNHESIHNDNLAGKDGRRPVLITLEPGKRGGKPCIRGLRVTVYDVLENLASGMSHRKASL